MRIVVVWTGPLFGHDETRLYAEQLSKALSAAGHTVELTTIPFSSAIADIAPQSAAYHLFDLRGSADICVAIGPFSHALKHESKRLWVFSRYSPFYEHWGTAFGAVAASQTNLGLREYVQRMDQSWISEAQLVRTASRSLKRALSEQSEGRAEVLLPALLEVFETKSSGYGDHLLTMGRLTDSMRFSLLINAFGESTASARLVILGYESTPEEREYVEQLIGASPKAASITLEVDPSYDRCRSFLASSTGVVTAPYRAEVTDAFTLAAGWAGKPVITTKDSGDPALCIEDGVGGCVVDPDPAAIAQAMDRIHASPKSARALGNRLSEKLRSSLPSWESIAMELTR